MQFNTIAIVGKYHAQGIDQPLSEIAAFVQARGARVVFDRDTAGALGESAGYDVDALGRMAEVAIVVGGDGTMLGLARELAPFNVPLIGINHGRVGFMTDIALKDWKSALEPMLDGTYDTEERSMLEASVHRGEQELVRARALNDVVVSRSGVGGMIELSAQVDGLYMYHQRADGLIIATPTGSTAYALSAHGPILHPTVAGLVLVPVAPQALSNRPIVLPDHSQIELTLTRSPGGRDNTSSVHFDMQTWSHLQEGDRILVRRAQHTIRFLHPAGSNYFATLRRKLHWNLMPSEQQDES